MKDREKTKEQLVDELGALRQRVAELEAAETERERAEEALRESEERYRSIVELAPDGILTVNLKGVATSCNSAFLELTGFSRDEIVGTHVSKFPTLRIEDIPQYTKMIFAAARGKTFKPFEFIWVHKDGTSRWGEAHIGLMKKGSRIVGLQLVLRDITERKRAEETLRESEERYRLIAEHVTDVIWVTDMDLGFTYVSPSVEYLRGYSAEEVMAQSLSDVLAPASLVRAMEILEEERENIEKGTAQPRTVEFEFRCKDGSTVQTESTVSILYDENKMPVGILGSTRDITERKRAQEALRESEERYRNIVELAPEGIITVNLKGVVTTCNTAFVRLTGFSEDEVVGKRFYELPTLYPQKISRYFHMLRSAMRGKIPKPFEFMWLHKDGMTRWGEAHAGLMKKGSKIIGFQAILLDVTERKQAEEERERLVTQIRGQAQRMQQILDTVPEGVLLLDADERIMLVNPVAERELVALADAKTGDTLAHLGERPLAELLTSPPQGLWHEVATDSRSFQVIARPIENGSAPAGWVLVIRDVTQQREIEQRIQQQERLAAVGQLAAGIAHDFNNIMASIVLYAELTARMEGLPGVVRERMGTIDQQAGHATRLIQQILDFSRRAVLERRPLDLLLLLKEQVKLLECTLPESIKILLTYGPGEYVVRADPTRMQQMVTNLALNARDAMPEGGTLRIGLGRIEVRPGESPPLPEMKAGEWVRVEFSDTGAGIPPDALPHIFEPFFTTRAPLGSGLGLAQVHGIVGQHEGKIDVETQVGRGTTLTIYLPAHSLEPSPPATPGELSTLPTGQGETILVVEDDDVVRKALVESLEMLNYRALGAASGREALALLEQRGDEAGRDVDRIVLVLSDVVMPGMGGVALLHALRERDLRVPLVMLTGHPLEREMEELQVQGMIDWLPKPPSLEQLAGVLARALGSNR